MRLVALLLHRGSADVQLQLDSTSTAGPTGRHSHARLLSRVEKANSGSSSDRLSASPEFCRSVVRLLLAASGSAFDRPTAQGQAPSAALTVRLCAGFGLHGMAWHGVAWRGMKLSVTAFAPACVLVERCGGRLVVQLPVVGSGTA